MHVYNMDSKLYCWGVWLWALFGGEGLHVENVSERLAKRKPIRDNQGLVQCDQFIKQVSVLFELVLIPIDTNRTAF